MHYQTKIVKKLKAQKELTKAERQQKVENNYPKGTQLKSIRSPRIVYISSGVFIESDFDESIIDQETNAVIWSSELKKFAEVIENK